MNIPAWPAKLDVVICINIPLTVGFVPVAVLLNWKLADDPEGAASIPPQTLSSSASVSSGSSLMLLTLLSYRFIEVADNLLCRSCRTTKNLTIERKRKR